MARMSAVFRGYDMAVDQIALGEAVVTMIVRPDMANTYGVCHGGMIFSLADTAFGLAANAYDERIVTASAEIHYIAPIPMGTTLRAIATEVHRGPRSGLYDVRIEGLLASTTSLAPSNEVGGTADETEPSAHKPQTQTHPTIGPSAHEAPTVFAHMRGRARIIGGPVVPIPD